MTKEHPRVREFMTTMPVTIDVRSDLARAREVMGDRSVRHLPVVNDGALVGIVSDRDLRLCEELGKAPHAVEVAQVMQRRVFTCGPEAHLHAVAEEMAEHKYGAAIVVEREHPLKVVGVFTTVDALRALARFTRDDC